VAVADQGPGIAEGDRAQLARRFFRADSARGRPGGFGLGLAITQAYLHLLGGTLDFEPRLPRGSIFRLSLPRDKALPPAT
jgi:signal transduction histidine kinase